MSFVRAQDILHPHHDLFRSIILFLLPVDLQRLGNSSQSLRTFILYHFNENNRKTMDLFETNYFLHSIPSTIKCKRTRESYKQRINHMGTGCVVSKTLFNLHCMVTGRCAFCRSHRFMGKLSPGMSLSAHPLCLRDNTLNTFYVNKFFQTTAAFRAIPTETYVGYRQIYGTTYTYQVVFENKHSIVPPHWTLSFSGR